MKQFLFCLTALVLLCSFASADGFVSNTTVNWMHNEVDSQFPLYQQLKNVSTDVSMVTSAPINLNSVGVTCFSNNWTTPIFNN